MTSGAPSLGTAAVLKELDTAERLLESARTLRGDGHQKSAFAEARRAYTHVFAALERMPARDQRI